MKKILILMAMALPICASALSKEEAIFKKYFTQPVAAKQSSVSPGAKTRIKLVCPTFFFEKEEAGLLLQLARVEISGATGGNMLVRAIRLGGLSYDNPVNGNEAIIKVPDLRQKAELELKLIENGKEIQALKFDWAPARQWKVYISSVSHLDIGYTNITENVMKKRNEITAMALDFIKQTDSWPEDAKYRWTMEGSWELKHFLEEHPDRLAELKKRAQEGRLEVCAKLVHEHTETEGYEELFRDVYYGKLEVEPMLGSSVVTMMLNDVDGVTWGEVSALASSGVKYFSMNPNSFYRGGNILHYTKFPQAFYWQGPGPGEILTWRSKDAYTEAPYLFKGYDKTLEGMTERLEGYEQNNYGYDAIHITRSGADKSGANDNSWPRFETCQVIKEWDAQFAYPRLISATPVMFFNYLEKNYEPGIPKAKADMPDWWADGVITEAKWTAMSRDLHHLLYQTEALASIASIFDTSYQYPRREINDAYYNNIMFDEHTWGYMLNTAPQHKQIFDIKSGWLEHAFTQTGDLQESTLAGLAKRIGGSGNTIIVFNPLSWQRNDLVNFPWQKSDCISIIDRQTNEALLFQIKQSEQGNKQVYFVAKNLPPVGYKSYEIADGCVKSGQYEKVPNGGMSGASGNYFIKIDPQKYTYSMVDIKNNRELLAGKTGELIFRKQDNLLNIVDVKKSGKINSMEGSLGPVFSTAWLKIQDPGNLGAEAVEELKFCHELDWIDITVHYPRYHNQSNESRYLAFPFNVPDFEIWVETPYGKMRPYYDQLPEFAKFYTVAHNVELRSKSEGFSIIWSTKEAPMVELGEITKKASWTSQMFWPFFYKPGVYPWNPDQPTIYSEIMNNFQNTNFSPSQKGEMTFHYRITVIDNKDLDKAHRPGWELSLPDMAVVAENGTGELPAMGSFVAVSPDNVMITAFKQAEDGDGYIVRLYEAAGKTAVVRVQFPLFKLSGAWLTDGVERVQQKLEVKNQMIEIPLAQYQVKTIRVKLGR